MDHKEETNSISVQNELKMLRRGERFLGAPVQIQSDRTTFTQIKLGFGLLGWIISMTSIFGGAARR